MTEPTLQDMERQAKDTVERLRSRTSTNPEYTDTDAVTAAIGMAREGSDRVVIRRTLEREFRLTSDEAATVTSYASGYSSSNP